MSVKLKPEVKSKWIVALLSGDYKQADGVLRNEYGYCCLGVLCDLYIKEFGDSCDLKWGKLTELNDSGMFAYYLLDASTDEEKEAQFLPLEVSLWAFIDDVADTAFCCPFGIDDETSSLSDENDDGKSFEEITQLIEEFF